MLRTKAETSNSMKTNKDHSTPTKGNKHSQRFENVKQRLKNESENRRNSVEDSNCDARNEK